MMNIIVVVLGASISRIAWTSINRNNNMKILHLTNNQQYTILDIYTFTNTTKVILKDIEDEKELELELNSRCILLKIEQELYVYIPLEEPNVLRVKEQCNTSIYVTIDDGLINFYHMNSKIRFDFWYGHVLHITEIEFATLLLSLL